MSTPIDQVAKRIAADVLQRIADSEPDADSIEGMERLQDTPQADMFVLHGETIEHFIYLTLSDALIDGHLVEALEPKQIGRDAEPLR